MFLSILFLIIFSSSITFSSNLRDFLWECTYEEKILSLDRIQIIIDNHVKNYEKLIQDGLRHTSKIFEIYMSQWNSWSKRARSIEFMLSDYSEYTYTLLKGDKKKHSIAMNCFESWCKMSHKLFRGLLLKEVTPLILHNKITSTGDIVDLYCKKKKLFFSTLKNHLK